MATKKSDVQHVRSTRGRKEGEALSARQKYLSIASPVTGGTMPRSMNGVVKWLNEESKKNGAVTVPVDEELDKAIRASLDRAEKSGATVTVKGGRKRPAYEALTQGSTVRLSIFSVDNDTLQSLQESDPDIPDRKVTEDMAADASTQLPPVNEGFADAADPQAIGALVRQMRAAAGMSQTDVIRETDIALRTLSKIETGRTQPNTGVLVKIAEATGFDLQIGFVPKK